MESLDIFVEFKFDHIKSPLPRIGSSFGELRHFVWTSDLAI